MFIQREAKVSRVFPFQRPLPTPGCPRPSPLSFSSFLLTTLGWGEPLFPTQRALDRYGPARGGGSHVEREALGSLGMWDELCAHRY